MTTKLHPAVGLLVVAVATAGCEPGAPPAPATIRDSADVRIVQNGGVAGLPTDRLRRPEVRVGWTDDGPWFDRIQGGSLLAEGGAVLADDRTPRIWVIGADGAARGFGKRGEGPGELQWPGHAFEFDDGALAVHDYGRNMTLRYTPQGEFIGAGPPQPGGEIGLRPVRELASGRVGWAPEGFRAGSVFHNAAGWISIPAVVGAPLGGPTDTLFIQNGVHRGTPGERLRWTDPFAARRTLGMARAGPVAARPDIPEVRWYDEAGDLSQIARWTQEPEPVTEAVWEAWVAGQMGRNASSPERLEDARLAQIMRDQREAASSTLPRFVWATVGGDGQVWLAESPYSEGGEDGLHRFLRLASNGELLGWVEFSRPIHAVLDVADDRVLVVERDDFDVEAMAIYRVPSR